MNKKNKKAIGPVVATALLLVVAVVSVVGFQTWFQSYSTTTFSNVESQSGSSFNTGIDTVIGDKLYFKNGGTSNISLTQIKLDGVVCNLPTNLSPGMNEINLNQCSVSTNKILSGVSEIVLTTPKQLYVKKFILNNLVLCQNNWISVTGNSVLGTSNFCVMKYEAKNVGGVATSQAALSPWVSINQTDARAACSALGTGYHLIADPEWVTIARLAENDASNWANGVIGSTVSSGGGMYRGNVNLIDSVGCGSNPVLDSNTAGTSCVVSSRNKRTLNISGNMLWDLSGNVWEWTDDTITYNSRYYGGANTWMSYSSDDGTTKIATSPTFPSLKLPSNGWNSNQGMGRYYDGFNAGGTWTGSAYTGTVAGFLRGGRWYDGAVAGAFALNLFLTPSPFGSDIGFRCSYAP